MKDLKYLLGYIIPISGLYSIQSHGLFTWTTVLLAFILIPIIESLLPVSPQNLSSYEEEKYEQNHLFDALLFLNIPFVLINCAFFLTRLDGHQLSVTEIAGMIFSLGIVLATSGINVGHELGHRQDQLSQWAARILLLPSLYMHFTIEHNLGHHKNVATPEDPATARRNETLYSFWWRSVTRGFYNAFQIEKGRFRKNWHQNKVVHYVLIELVFLVVLAFVFGLDVTLFFFIAALISIALLESINYVEHYGLQREKLPNGRYEPVQPRHSWNSDHTLGRIMLYELTRHSDHHYKASRKYQILRHIDESPQLPYGYPGSILLAMVPPLWFRKMHEITGFFILALICFA